MIVLAVKTYNGAAIDPLQARFDAAGGTIGRADGNQLVLPDPDRTISRVHASIAWREGAFFIEDKGSNPVLINGVAMGQGLSMPMAPGDELQIGGYVIDVRADAPAPEAATPIPDDWDPFATAPRLRANVTLPLAAAPSPPPVAAPAPDPEMATMVIAASQLPEGQQSPSLERLAGLSGLSAPAAPAPPAEVADLDLPLDVAPTPPPAPPADARRTPVVSWEIPRQVTVVASAASGRPPSALATQLGTRPGLRPREPAPAAAAAAAPPPPATDELLQAFVSGLGTGQALPVTQLTPGLMHLVGGLLAEAIAGTVDLLQARAAIKNELRADVTAIRPRQNNPLKFSPTPEVALQHMLTPTVPGFLPAQAALRDAFTDLRAHEVAVMAGMRAALAGLLQRFDPRSLETQLSHQSGLGSLLAGGRRAQLWEAYQNLYAQLSSEAEDDFHTLFGRAFLKAYEAQQAQLRNAEPGGGAE